MTWRRSRRLRRSGNLIAWQLKGFGPSSLHWTCRLRHSNLRRDQDAAHGGGLRLYRRFLFFGEWDEFQMTGAS